MTLHSGRRAFAAGAPLPAWNCFKYINIVLYFQNGIRYSLSFSGPSWNWGLARAGKGPYVSRPVFIKEALCRELGW